MVIVSDELDARLRLEARRRGVAIAEVAREAIAAYLDGRGNPGRLSFFGIGLGEPEDASERIDEFVNEAVARDAVDTSG
jgi:hypothetical protein